MGPKKRNAAQRSKQSQAPAASPPAADGAVQAETEPVRTPIATKADALAESGSSSSSNTAKDKCGKAWNSLKRGTHAKALRTMKDLCSRYENSPHDAFVHHVQGKVCDKVASLMDDLNAKQKNLNNAKESAKRAVKLSPNSLEFAYFYANLLYETASEAKEYEEAAAECERALAIENPVDPAKDSLHEDSQQKQTTAEERIGKVQDDLRNLMQKSNFASISTWMKNLGGEEKFRLIPIRRATEDPMELRLVQAKRPNEIKKATKTEEERRKEIEVKVTAARLLQQQQSEAAGSLKEGSDKGSGISGSGPRASSDKRKHGKKDPSPAEKKELIVRSYWSSLSNEKKKEWLRVRVSDLNAHFKFSKDVGASEVISKAMDHAAANKTWNFWVCSKCYLKLSDAESHIKHVEGHLADVVPTNELPQPDDVEDLVKMIHDCSWKPSDIPAAVKMLENQHKIQDSDPAVVVSSRQKGEDVADSAVGSDDAARNTSSHSSRKNQSHASLADFPPDKWPLCDDPERAKLLDKIHALYEELIVHKYLAASHLRKVLQFAAEELQGSTGGSQLVNQGVNHTPAFICFLGVNQLKKILKFLQEVCSSCGLGRHPRKKTSPMHERNIANQGGEMNEKIILNEDASCIILDEALVPAECAQSTVNDVVGRNSSKGGSDTDAFLAWIYSGPSSGVEELESWVRRKEEKVKQHSEIYEMLKKERSGLHALGKRKSELVGYKDALVMINKLCVEAGQLRENGDEMAQTSHEAVLLKRKEEVKAHEHDNYADVSSSSSYEMEAVNNVLREAGALGANQFGDADAGNSLSSDFVDLESGENHDGRAKEQFHQMNGSIEVTMQKQKCESLTEICKVDARIMRSHQTFQQMESSIDAVMLDYRWILVPVIKSYMRAQLEDLAEKDAIEKSDAIRKSLLAEEELDLSKGVKGGNDSSKHGTDKAKDKKRHKEHRKAKDSKTSAASEQRPISPETVEPDSSALPSDGDRPDSEIVTAVHASELNEQEEELRRRMELEAEGRKLEETLEYQRRVENETKQRHLAEKQKKLTQTQWGKATGGFSDVLKEPSADDHDKDSSKSQDGLPVAPIPSGSPTIHDAQKSGSTDHTEAKRGSSESGFPQDSTIKTDQRPGRRGRRQKVSPKLVEGKSQSSSPSAKENAGAVTLESSSHDNIRDDVHPTLGEHETKTSKESPTKDDDEERFQSDLEKAVQQSLEAFHSHRKVPSPSSAVQGATKPVDTPDVDSAPSEHASSLPDVSDMLGARLLNENGEYNCFLNVILQSLWHLRSFHDEFLKRSTSDHSHVGDPCVICSLYEVFHALSFATADSKREAVAPTSLRAALSKKYPNSNFFQEGEMNDASEVLSAIFDCLQQSNNCLVHSLFGMDIFEKMNCCSCGLESRHLKYTSFFHNINANALRSTKAESSESSFDALLDLVERRHHLACDRDCGGCGTFNPIHHFLSRAPRVFTVVLGWQKTHESPTDIAATLAALSSEIDMSVLYRGLDRNHIHSLVSVVCYYGQHYCCFAYSHEIDRWIKYDDTIVDIIGGWADVLESCKIGHLQPQVLLFESVE